MYRELWHNQKRSWLQVGPDLQVRNSDLIIRSKYSLVSLGTERLVTTTPLDSTTAMKMALPMMQGSFCSSFTYGYSLVGTVIEGEKKFAGKSVHLLHPHQEIAQVNCKNAYIIKDLDLKVATLISNMETAVNAVWDADLEDNEEILVIGYGTVGALIGIAAKYMKNCEVYIQDLDSLKQSKAQKHGFLVWAPLEKKFKTTFHTSSTQEGLQQSIDAIGFEGQVIELSWYGAKNVSLNLGSGFHYDRKKIISSQVGHVSQNAPAGIGYSERKDLAIEILRNTNPKYLIEREINFNETPQFFADLRKRKVKDLGVIINYN